MLKPRRLARGLAGAWLVRNFANMKTRLVLFGILALGFVSLSAQPAKPAAPTKAEKKEEAEPKIAGIAIQRPNGAFLGLSLENGTFKLSFYDRKKKPALPDLRRAAARWNPNYKQGSERMILNPSADGKSLIGNKPVRPPHAFKLYLTLLTAAPVSGGDGAEQASESYVVDFHL